MNDWKIAISGLALIICSLSVAGCSTVAMEAVSPSLATDRPQITFTGEVPAWSDDANAIMQELEQWRGRTFNEDLTVTFLPQEDPNLNGWYNSATKELVVTLGSSEQMGRGVLLHEIYHALQDQNFNLYQLHLNSQDQPDYDRAVTAIIEGEAMLAVSELMNYNFLDHARLPTEGPIQEAFFEKVFLYGAGLRFIQAVRASGGWEAVDAVFQDPPQATTLIFQPERYLAGERSTPLLEVPTQAGETITAQSIRGEYEIQLLLAQVPELRPQLDAISENYMTDTLASLEVTDGSMHRWLIQFDSDEAALEWQSRFTTALAYKGLVSTVTADGAFLILEW